MKLYIGLVHHPIVGRDDTVVTTAVTNQDIHDLARSARTYDAAGYYIITPIAQQRSLVTRIVAHWRDGEGRNHQPTRARSFERVHVADSIATAVAEITKITGHTPICIGTTARPTNATTTYRAMGTRIANEQGSALLLLGTGWGLAPAAMALAGVILPPIEAIAGRDGYNHLSVRSAGAIVLDRLLGTREPD
ncbi:MAG: hypothetical protein ACI9MR_001653 [Myxococcota bacterium]|jgi:hypothetical protein